MHPKPERAPDEMVPELAFADDLEKQETDEYSKMDFERAPAELQHSYVVLQESMEVQNALVPAQQVPTVRKAARRIMQAQKKILKYTKSLGVAIGMLYAAQGAVMVGAENIPSRTLQEQAHISSHELNEAERIAKDILSLEERILNLPGTQVELARMASPSSQESTQAEEELRNEMLEEVDTEVLKTAQHQLQTGTFDIERDVDEWRQDLYQEAAQTVGQRHGVSLRMPSDEIISRPVALYSMLETHIKHITPTDPEIAVAMSEALDDGNGYVLALDVLHNPRLAADMISEYVNGSSGDIKIQVGVIVDRTTDLAAVSRYLQPEDRSILRQILQDAARDTTDAQYASRLRQAVATLE